MICRSISIIDLSTVIFSVVPIQGHVASCFRLGMLRLVLLMERE
jgi:hypothetical protein